MSASRTSPRAAVTLHDVAQRAGVSVATVSRVFNHATVVSAQTAQQVREAADALGFRLNPMGRALRAGRTRAIGVMLPTLVHPVFAHCLDAIESAARAAQLSVSFAATGYDAGNEEQASELLLQQRVDGLLLTVADAARSRVLDKLDHEGKPYVLLYNQPGARGRASQRPSVSVDNRLAARQMVSHLLQAGHRRICMVAGSFRQSDRARLRFKGYVDAMTQHGLAPLEPLETAFMTADLRARLQDLLSQRDAPTALFCSSDQLALMVMRDLRRLGLRVPQDISVAGFDGVPVGELITPVLTTVVQPTADIAASAFDLLQSLIVGERYLGPALLHHTLREGGTVAVQHTAAVATGLPGTRHAGTAGSPGAFEAPSAPVAAHPATHARTKGNP
ncbi:MAG: LacI family DNA-binding transcriptional regulator [Rubrivivax sp.]|jgi:DNA-binding LacI/PurR family transcriptional regulator|nr:LacI family DNA-binding transcriptional regulator [Rubrivivax sp.]